MVIWFDEVDAVNVVKVMRTFSAPAGAIFKTLVPLAMLPSIFR